MDQRINKINERIDNLTEVVFSLSTRVDRLAEKVEENTVELRELKAKEKIIENIIRRIQKLEERVFA